MTYLLCINSCILSSLDNFETPVCALGLPEKKDRAVEDLQYGAKKDRAIEDLQYGAAYRGIPKTRHSGLCLTRRSRDDVDG